MREPAPPSGEPFPNRVFNNADSYAQAFDEAWQEHRRLHPEAELGINERLSLILDQLQGHPFHQNHPERAAEVAAFRVRLLGL
jgi:hypothetical protein